MEKWTDGGGGGGAPLCHAVFWGNLKNVYVGAPSQRVGDPPMKILDPPRWVGGGGRADPPLQYKMNLHFKLRMIINYLY